MENKTAIEWLEAQIIDGNRFIFEGKPDTLLIHLPIDALEKAKTMEEEQIIKAFNYGNADTDLAYGSEYFKKTYKK